jgi:uncharacterized protein YjgD (DUF1641 family)
MSDVKMQKQIDEINQKLDLVLEHVNEQRLKTNSVEDLISDVSIVAKDVYDTAVEELTDQQVVLNMDEVKQLGIRFMKNINNFSMALDTFESISDLTKDLKPIANEAIIDSINKLNEFEEKGYITFMKESTGIVRNIMDHFSQDDVKDLSENVVSIMETIRSMSQPEMLKTINNALTVYKHIDLDNIPEMSIWKIMREINTPEMKKGMGFIISFLKNISSVDNKNITKN